MKKIKNEKIILASIEANNYWNKYGYGKNIEKLKTGREVSLIRAVGSIKFEPGDIKIIIGFMPKVILISYSYSSTNQGGKGDGLVEQDKNLIKQTCNYEYKTITEVSVGETTIEIPNLQYGSDDMNIMFGNNIKGQLVSFDKFGFTLNTNFSGNFSFLALK